MPSLLNKDMLRPDWEDYAARAMYFYNFVRPSITLEEWDEYLAFKGASKDGETQPAKSQAL